MLVVRDRDTGHMIAVRAVSGGHPPPGWIGTSASIPNGRYDILDQGRKADHLRLEPLDSHYGNDHIDGGPNDGRGEFRIHVPGHGWTVGCISICNLDAANDAIAFIRGTKSTTVTVDKKGWWNQGKTEQITKFGTLTVTGSPSAGWAQPPLDPNRSPNGDHSGAYCDKYPMYCSVGHVH
jgi:hypothetical protein